MAGRGESPAKADCIFLALIMNTAHAHGHDRGECSCQSGASHSHIQREHKNIIEDYIKSAS